MLLNQNNNELIENNKNQNLNYSNIFRKVDLQIKLNKIPEKKILEKSKEIKLPYIDINREIMGRKLAHLQNFCNSIYSNYNNNNINSTIENIFNIREQMNDILNESKLKAIEDIKHYFFINKFPNEVNFHKNYNFDFYKKINTSKARIKPLSLNKIKEKINSIQEEDKFTLITTLNVKKEKNEEKNNKMFKSIDSHSSRNRNKKFNFEDYAKNEIKSKHPILYQLSQNKNRNKKNYLPKIERKNKIFNDIVEVSKLIPDNTEINKEYKKNNYDEYMRLKELKIMK